MTVTIDKRNSVSQALGYLHHRGIIHKNLKSKNIHLSDKKAVICDFGLGSMTDLKLKSCEKGYEVFIITTDYRNSNIPIWQYCHTFSAI